MSQPTVERLVNGVSAAGGASVVCLYIILIMICLALFVQIGTCT